MAHDKNCKNCGKPFTGNINRDFCTDACRKYYKRHGGVSLTGHSKALTTDKSGLDRTTPRSSGSSIGNYAAKKGIDLVAKMFENSLVEVPKTTLSNVVLTSNDTPLQAISAVSSANKSSTGQTLNKVVLTAEVQEFLGDITYPFKMLVWGLPGSGKSTFCMLLANELAANHRILYIAGEEALDSHTLLDKQRRMIDATNSRRCVFLNRLPKTQIEWKQMLYPGGPFQLLSTKAIFYDSVTKLSITPFYVDAAANDYKLSKLTKSTAHIFITHAHKDGQQYRGDGSWGHEVDVVVRVEKGIAITGKNRFGKVGETLKVF